MAKKRLTSTARKLRRDMTETETRLWTRIRGSQLENHKFVRQFPIGTAITDFACRSAKLVVELDGGQHSESLSDEARTKMIAAHGYTVIRFWNNDISENIDGVLEEIRHALRNAKNG